ncbi:MAG: SMP-30/gluconolactonase/LRE family protein [Actinomycetota bacterium]|nr:MAG: SMP-30/gluconolactonase/LRE family protein [Actinomycetota bacterium]
MRAEPITEPITAFGESPVWDDAWGGLRWVDMFRGDILSLAADGAVRRHHVDSHVSTLRPRQGGGTVVACGRRLMLLDATEGTQFSETLPGNEAMLLNDGACDPEGRFYCGSWVSGRREAGHLYRLDPDRSVHVVLEKITSSNGLDWSPDGSRAYYVDTGTQRVDVFDYDAEGGLQNRRPFVTIDPGPDRIAPDGLCVDAEGGVWVALIRGGRVQRHTPRGDLDEIVEVATPHVTACTFGGPRLDQLFITTYRPAGADDPGPAGAVFQAPAGVAGQPVRPFAG